jgi:regulator of protease activity HflC (stomatin/prohibitin superfamily)
MDPAGLVVGLVIFLVVAFFLVNSIKVIRQRQVGVVERLGKFNRTLGPGPHLVVPIIDRVRYKLDMREAVVPFPPQGVITEDNLMVSIDSVIYFQILDPERAAYEAQDYIKAIEQLTQTTLRNIIGGLDLEQTLTSREEINQKLRVVLDEATGKWGIKVNRVELRAIDPPATIRDAMEKGARAERDKRAAILTAEGQRQSSILNAGGDKESAILRAQGDREAAVLRAQADRQAAMLRAEGEAQAITTVFSAIHAGQPDQALLAYQYMQMLPSIAQGDANKVWVVPSEITKALEGLGSAVGTLQGGAQSAGSAGPSGGQSGARSAIPQGNSGSFTAPEKIDVQAEIEAQNAKEADAAAKTVQDAIDEARNLERTRRDALPPLRSARSGDQLGIGSGQPAAGAGESTGESAGDTEDSTDRTGAPEFAPPGKLT